MKTLFTDNFPYVKDEAELQVLKDRYPNYDSYYVTSGSIKDRKNKFDALYQKYYPYEDAHFLTEIKKKFNQRTWEMYVSCVFLDRGINISSGDTGPDILIESDKGKKVWVECIACEKGDGKDRVPDSINGIIQSVPSDEMLIRISSALKAKHDKYEKYVRDGIIKKEDIFIISINRGELDHVDASLPLILRAVFAIGYQTISRPINGGPSKYGWSTIPFIEKKNGSKVPMNFFLEKKYEGISAVIYSNKNVLNHPKILGEDIVIVHNPLAKNPVVSKVFNSFKTYKCDTNGDIKL